MPNYWRRVYKLELGGEDVDPLEFGSLDLPTKDRPITPLQVEFEIDQTPNGFVSYAEITIYGLRSSTKERIYREYTSVRLTAGYVDNYGPIFKGSIVNIESGRDAAEHWVKLYCRSGGRQWESQTISQSFGEGTPQIEIIRAVAESFGYPVQIQGDFSNLPPAVLGKTLDQDSKSAMEGLARDFDLTWLMQNDTLVVLAPDTVIPSDEPTFTPTTGLVGSPSITILGADIIVKLSGSIRPGQAFNLEAQTGQFSFNSVYYKKFPDTIGKGRYRVLSMKHSGSFYGDNWDTTLEGLRL